jgi:hypothetical protein
MTQIQNFVFVAQGQTLFIGTSYNLDTEIVKYHPPFHTEESNTSLEPNIIYGNYVMVALEASSLCKMILQWNCHMQG